jgi:hypothetical protein
MKKVFLSLLMLSLVSLLFFACSNREKSASEMLNKVLTLQQIGKHDEADKLLENIIQSYPETKIASELRKNVLASQVEYERSKLASLAERKAQEPVILYTPPPWAGNIPEHRAYTQNPVNNRQGLSSQSGTGNMEESIPDNQLSRGSNRGSSVDLEKAVFFMEKANEYRSAAIDRHKTNPRDSERLSRLADQFEQKANEYQKRYDEPDSNGAPRVESKNIEFEKRRLEERIRWNENRKMPEKERERQNDIAKRRIDELEKDPGYYFYKKEERRGSRSPITTPPPLPEINSGAFINGRFYPPAAGGIIDPRTGTFCPEIAGGYKNKSTGQFIPKF